jgi:hypothetical protein
MLRTLTRRRLTSADVGADAPDGLGGWSERWECGRLSQRRILKRKLGDQAVVIPAIRMPEDIQRRDNEFWRWVEHAIKEALEEE